MYFSEILKAEQTYHLGVLKKDLDFTEAQSVVDFFTFKIEQVYKVVLWLDISYYCI